MLLGSIVLYIAALFAISFLTKGNKSNADFYIGGQRSPWWAVAVGMVGASISGVTFVSVPGWVSSTGFTYLQMVMGFIVGYLLIAYVLLPRYYQSRQVSIYAILEERLGSLGRKTSSLCFVLNKLATTSVKHYVVVLSLYKILFEPMGVSFPVVAFLSVLIAWLYSFNNGIRTIVWTDFLQTVLLTLALVLLLFKALSISDVGWTETFASITLFDWEWGSKQNFFKMFLSGAFVVLVMTGMDQDLMQKNLSCKTLKEAQRNMISYGFLFLPLNFLLLLLGTLLLPFATEQGDAILPAFCNAVGGVTLVCFVIGMLASSFSSIDSAMASVTTSLLKDLKGIENVSRTKRVGTHALVALFLAMLVCLHNEGGNAAIDVVYTIVSYLYGPVLGLFAFALFSKRFVEKWAVLIPVVAVLSVGLSHIVKTLLSHADYVMGYELLLLNGLLMFLGLLLISQTRPHTN